MVRKVRRIACWEIRSAVMSEKLKKTQSVNRNKPKPTIKQTEELAASINQLSSASFDSVRQGTRYGTRDIQHGFGTEISDILQ